MRDAFDPTNLLVTDTGRRPNPTDRLLYRALLAVLVAALVGSLMVGLHSVSSSTGGAGDASPPVTET